MNSPHHQLIVHLFSRKHAWRLLNVELSVNWNDNSRQRWGGIEAMHAATQPQTRKLQQVC